MSKVIENYRWSRQGSTIIIAQKNLREKVQCGLFLQDTITNFKNFIGFLCCICVKNQTICLSPLHHNQLQTLFEGTKLICSSYFFYPLLSQAIKWEIKHGKKLSHFWFNMCIHICLCYRLMSIFLKDDNHYIHIHNIMFLV